jgi:hypothetical protein
MPFEKHLPFFMRKSLLCCIVAHKQKWLLKSKKRPTSHFTPLRYHVGTTAQKLQFPDTKFRRAMNCADKKRRASDSNHAFGMNPWKKKLN